jgi:hypothetical protein
MLSDLRERFASGELRKSKGDSMLYLAARMHDAEDETKGYMKKLVATENAAIDIIRRFDADGSLVAEFKQRVEEHLRHYEGTRNA